MTSLLPGFQSRISMHVHTWLKSVSPLPSCSAANRKKMKRTQGLQDTFVILISSSIIPISRGALSIHDRMLLSDPVCTAHTLWVDTCINYRPTLCNQGRYRNLKPIPQQNCKGTFALSLDTDRKGSWLKKRNRRSGRTTACRRQHGGQEPHQSRASAFHL